MRQFKLPRKSRARSLTAFPVPARLSLVHDRPPFHRIGRCFCADATSFKANVFAATVACIRRLPTILCPLIRADAQITPSSVALKVYTGHDPTTHRRHRLGRPSRLCTGGSCPCGHIWQEANGWHDLNDDEFRGPLAPHISCSEGRAAAENWYQANMGGTIARSQALPDPPEKYQASLCVTLFPGVSRAVPNPADAFTNLLKIGDVSPLCRQGMLRRKPNVLQNLDYIRGKFRLRPA